MLYTKHTGNQLLGNLYRGAMPTKKSSLDRSAPGRYAPGDASVGPINMGGEIKKEKGKK